MQDVFCELKLTGVAASLCNALGVEKPECAGEPLEAITELCKNQGVDRVLMYNPDAVALWIFEKYAPLFTPVMLNTSITLPLQAVMPSVTPVCFGTMYTGAISISMLSSISGITSREAKEVCLLPDASKGETRTSL